MIDISGLLQSSPHCIEVISGPKFWKTCVTMKFIDDDDDDDVCTICGPVFQFNEHGSTGKWPLYLSRKLLLVV